LKAHRDWFGSLLGMAVFLGGVGLLLMTFKIAYEMFSVSPHDALNLQQGKPVDLGQAGETFAGLLLKVLLLVVMAIVGSLVANRGIKLYSHSSRVDGAPPSEP
jgi:hypothetical protein